MPAVIDLNLPTAEVFASPAVLGAVRGRFATRGTNRRVRRPKHSGGDGGRTGGGGGEVRLGEVVCSCATEAVAALASEYVVWAVYASAFPSGDLGGEIVPGAVDVRWWCRRIKYWRKAV